MTRRTGCAALTVLVLAAVCAAFVALRPPVLQTSLYDLVGSAAEAFPEAVRTQSSALVPLVVSAPDPAVARSAADALHARLVASPVTNACAAIRYRVDGESFNEILAFVAAHRAGLAAPSVRARLATPEGRAQLARAQLKRLYTDPTPPLFPLADDPFGLAEGFVRAQASSVSGWTPRDGVLAAERDGRFHILLLLDLLPACAADTDRLIAFKADLDAVLAALPLPADATLAAGGVPLHTATTAAACQREILLLSLLSLVFIAALSLFVFRRATVRVIGWIALSLAVSGLAGTLALLALFPSLHLMTLVFGTTLLGLVIDYSYHWLLQAPGERKGVIRSLVLSWLTTEVSLVPLLLSSLPVLRQSAAFLGVGLAAAMGTVLALYPRAAVAASVSAPPSRLPRALTRVAALVVVGAAALGAWALLGTVRFATPATALYAPPAELVAADRLFAEVSGVTGEERGLLSLSGGSLDALLEKEEALGLPADVPRLSRFLPSLAVRAAVADDVARLYAEQGAALSADLGLGTLQPPASPEPWDWDEVPSVARPFICNRSLVVSSAPRPSGELPSGVVFCQVQSQLAAVMDAWTHEALVRLGAALLLMLALLACVFRLRAALILAPSLLALGAVAGVHALMGAPVTLFHLLAAFLLVGMGLDSAIFFHGGGAAVLRPALCSFATSLVGFGLLAIVSFPVVRAFGLTLAIGLPVAFSAALLLARPAASMPGRPSAEVGASPLGLEILWFFYRLLGLRFLHFLASATGVVIWCSSRAVRRASPRLAKVVRFTQSLADKLVVMAEGRRRPLVETDGSEDAAAFVRDVQSRRGVFVLSSHVGTIEVLAALGECACVFHAWMEFERTGIFNRFYLHHAKRPKVIIHPISSFGPQTIFTAGDALDAGDCLLMAADRTFGRVRHETVDGRDFALAEGAFRFAAALDHPVYFVACVADRPCHYTAVIRRLTGPAKALGTAYAQTLAEMSAKYPDQWFAWNGTT